MHFVWSGIITACQQTNPFFLLSLVVSTMTNSKKDYIYGFVKKVNLAIVGRKASPNRLCQKLLNLGGVWFIGTKL
jgi:hypothetical protein